MAVLNKNIEIFIVYVNSSSIELKIIIHAAQNTKIALMLVTLKSQNLLLHDLTPHLRIVSTFQTTKFYASCRTVADKQCCLITSS